MTGIFYDITPNLGISAALGR